MTVDELAAAIRAAVEQNRRDSQATWELARCDDDLARVDRDLAALSAATYSDGTVETGSWLARAALDSLRSLARIHGINP